MRRKITGFDWDDGNWPKCGKHGLTKAEIEWVLSHNPLVLPDKNPPDDETRFNAVGKTEEGRMCFVVFTVRQQKSELLFRPISARYMHRKEIEKYEQR
jgi:uncharacterized DUF497 family protein